MIEFLTDLGLQAWAPIWMPVLTWSLAAAVGLLALKLVSGSQFQLQLDSRIGLLVALPAGIVLSHVARMLPAGVAPVVIVPAPPLVFLEPLGVSGAVGAFAPAIGLYTLIGVLTVTSGLLTIAGLFLFAAGIWRLRGITKRARPEAASDMPSLAGAQILVSDETRIPFSCGLWRRKIILPAGRHFGSGIEVKHEVLHHRHGDVWRVWIVAPIRALFFFHPLVHFLHRRTTLFTELACDHRVLSLGSVNVQEYREALVQSVLPGHSLGAPVVPMSRSRSQLKQRIDAMSRPNSSFIQGRPVLMIASLIVLGGALLSACGQSDSNLVEADGPLHPEIAASGDALWNLGAAFVAQGFTDPSMDTSSGLDRGLPYLERAYEIFKRTESVRLDAACRTLAVMYRDRNGKYSAECTLAISGVIRDSDTGLALVANVSVEGTSRGSVSSPTGGFSLNLLEPGLHTLRVSRSDYHTAVVPVEVHAKGAQQVAVDLHRRGEKWEVVVEGGD